MKTKYVTAIFVGSLVIGGALIWLLSSGPTPTVLIEPTQFENQREIGAAAFEKLSDRLRSQKIVIIGIPPQPATYQNLVFGFLEKLSAAEPNLVVLKEPKWPALPSDLKIENYDFVFNDEDLSVEAETIQRALNEGKTIVIYSVNIFSSHLVAGNPVQRLEKALKRKLSAISIGQLTLRHNGEHKNDPACVGSMRDVEGLYELGCAQLANSRKHYKKLLPLNKLMGLLVEQSEHDFLLQVYLPN